MPEALFVNGDIAACFAASILKKELAWRLEGDTFLEREGILCESSPSLLEGGDSHDLSGIPS